MGTPINVFLFLQELPWLTLVRPRTEGRTLRYPTSLVVRPTPSPPQYQPKVEDRTTRVPRMSVGYFNYCQNRTLSVSQGQDPRRFRSPTRPVVSV